MQTATTLRDLLRIRRQNTRRLRALPGYLGSAVGFKYRESSKSFALDESGRRIPAVILFVERKLSAAEIGPRVLERTLRGPDGLTCATDVVSGLLGRESPALPPLDNNNTTLLRQLHAGALAITGGLPLSSPYSTGTAACVTRRQKDGALCLLTNWHVAGPDGSVVLQPPPRLRALGITAGSTESANGRRPARPGVETIASYSDAVYRMDGGLVLLNPMAARNVRPGVHSLGQLGAAHVLDLDSMDMLGRRVVGVGQTLGRQSGTIMACGYEWRPDITQRAHEITDYLILGDRDRPFAAAGDSGKLVVTDDDERRPVALLWGGQRQQFWTAHAQDSWNYASALHPVLDTLGVELFLDGETAPNPYAPGRAQLLAAGRA